MSEEVAAPAAPTAAVGSSLTPEQLQQLAAAEQAVRPIASAAKLAAWNGYGLWLSAGLCLLSAAFDPWLLPTAVVLAGFGAAELHGRKRLQRHDRGAPLWLCVNQSLLLLATVGYALWQLHVGTSSEDPLAQALREHPELGGALSAPDAPGLGGLASDVGELYRTGVVLAYLGLIVLALLLQGGSALFYLSRKRRLEAFLRETPPWLQQVHRARR